MVIGLMLLHAIAARAALGHDLDGEARRRGVTPVTLGPGDDLRELAAEHADVIGMAGGDGSQALVADVARRHDIPFVCVPAGTRNHFALDLGLDRDDVVAALDAYGEAVERRVDLAVLGDRVFVNNASLGVYATVVQSPKYRDAKAATFAERLPELLGPDADRFDLHGTRERLNGGALGIVTLTVDRARDLPSLLTAELTGGLGRFRGYRTWQAEEFVVRSGQPLVEVGVDGEALRLAPPLRFRSLPGALRVRVPIGAPGAAPAALAPHGLRHSISALLRVLFGRPVVRPGSRR